MWFLSWSRFRASKKRAESDCCNEKRLATSAVTKCCTLFSSVFSLSSLLQILRNLFFWTLSLASNRRKPCQRCHASWLKFPHREPSRPRLSLLQRSGVLHDAYRDHSYCRPEKTCWRVYDILRLILQSFTSMKGIDSSPPFTLKICSRNSCVDWNESSSVMLNTHKNPSPLRK